MDTGSELVETIKACRTCGIHYVTPSKHQLKHLFQSTLEHSEILLIRLELAKWNVEVAENDGFPQYVCNTCIHKFEQVFELRAVCINAQNEFRKLYNVKNGNFANIKVKAELPDADEEQPLCDFIYVDDLSDTEYDGATPFNIPHVPIKEEIIEAATIPLEVSQQPSNIVESASRVVKAASASSHLPRNESVKASPSTAVVVQIAVEQVECKLCQHLSFNQEDHKQHMQRAHEMRDMECHICGKEFKNSIPARLKFHMKWHTLNKHVKCALCGFICNSKDALREHKRANHGKITCKICGKGVLTKKMKFHIRQHELTNYSCEYCKKAFATEIERENHIWQIHAHEDNNLHSNFLCAQTSNSPKNNEIILKMSQEKMCEEPQDDVVNYKFICAHCEQRFMEQSDLETHVDEDHSPEIHLTTAELETASIAAVQPEVTHHDQSNEVVHTNITVFEDYDNHAGIDVPDRDALINITPRVTEDNFMQSSSSSHFAAQTDHIENGELQHTDVISEYHTEKSLNSSSTDEEDCDVVESEDESGKNLPFVGNNLNTFACAKCTETFVNIEQLRQHHEKHLSLEQQQTTPSKPQFKCNLCGKSFDLKFSLNRHVKKHKHAQI